MTEPRGRMAEPDFPEDWTDERRRGFREALRARRERQVRAGQAFAFALVLIKSPSPMLVAVGMYLPPATTAAIFLGGCLKALVEWAARFSTAPARPSPRRDAVNRPRGFRSVRATRQSV